MVRNVFLFAMIFFALSALGHDGNSHFSPVEKAIPVPLGGDSVYNLGSTWTNQDGKPIPLSSLRGKVVVATMVYTSCRSACPMTISDLKRIEKSLPDGARNSVRFAIFSFDSERDTPAKLKEFAIARGLDPDRWSVLHGKSGDVRKLAAVLGIRYKRSSSGDYDHSNVISVLDRGGAILHQQIGLGQDPAETVGKIGGIVSGAAK
ncbi:MAG: SCO family protein [Bdellovibrionales bacterium]|nr:SCO family protein [Bdellovibrionales bacterium]